MIRLNPLLLLLVTVASLLLAACSSTSSDTKKLERDAGWAILPLANDSDNELANDNTEALLETHLRSRGVRDVESFTEVSLDKAVDGARRAGKRYAVSGTLTRWSDGSVTGRHPKVGLQLSVMDLANGQQVWNEKKLAIGKGSSVAAVANKAIAGLIANLPLSRSSNRPTSASSHTPVSTVPSLASALAADNVEVGGAARLSPVNLKGQVMAGRGVAIYYGARPPVDVLSNFDRLILEPDNITADELAALTKNDAVPYAYLSVGEVGPHRAYASQINRDWILGENTIWNSKVLDLSNPGWIAFLLQRIDNLKAAGYQGLFLDTMDSYHLYAKTPEQKAWQQAAMVEFLRAVNKRHPDLRLIANRGFEILEQGAQFLDAVAAESLYASWDNAAAEYVAVNSNDREWLMAQLKTAQKKHSLDIISIEYLPPSRRSEARKVAAKVASHGFIPWVSTPALDYVGVGLMEVEPRGVLMLYDSRVHGKLEDSVAHTRLSAPLEYFGYVPIYLDLASDVLPVSELKGVVAGAVLWSDQALTTPGLAAWFEKQLESSVPVVLLGSGAFALTTRMQELMGVSTASFELGSARITHRDALIGFGREVIPRPDYFGMTIKNQADTNEVHLTFEDRKKQNADLVLTGPWGGVALDPGLLVTDVDKIPYWVVDPFAFYSKALGLSSIPMPDVTTQNGRRMWLAHIDGDAFPSWAEMSGRQLGAEVIQQQILQQYRFPHTVSVVEGEMTAFPKYADRWSRMFRVAREIFALPNVEIATHTYSHPYAWQKVADYRGSGKYNLPIPGYQYTPQREIGGSANFINQKLAPAGKKTKVMLWSGDAVPLADALQAVDDAGLVNMNGGNTIITKARHSHALISPNSRPVGDHLQVYAPIMNENVYTNDWSGPYDGFRRVIETLELTDQPRRMKPINIYYHFYAGTKTATMKSLHEIYTWSTAQAINPVFVSEYAIKVPDYRRAGVARYLNDEWKLTGLGHINSIRLIGADLWPDLVSAQGLAGATDLHDGLYLHTDGADTVRFRLQSDRSSVPHLVSSNGQVRAWSVNGNSVSFRIVGNVPVELELGGAGISLCNISSKGRVLRGTRNANATTTFRFGTMDTGDAVLNCQA